MPADNKYQIEEILCALLGRIADKSTLLVVTVLGEEPLRFSLLRDTMGVNPKVLANTLRQMERDGLVARRLHRLVPPRVEYELTPLGKSLREAICRIWSWAEKHIDPGADRSQRVPFAPLLERAALEPAAPPLLQLVPAKRAPAQRAQTG